MKIKDLNLAILSNLSRYEGSYFEGHYLVTILRDIGEIEIEEGQWLAATCLPKAAVTAVVKQRDEVSVANSQEEFPYVLMGSTMNSGRTVFGPIPGFKHNPETAAADDTWVLILMEKDPRTSTFANGCDEWGIPTWTILKEGE